MATIQDVGQQILSGQPNKFYAFCGSEYGIKVRYIEILKQHYGSSTSAESVNAVLNVMKTKRIIPLQPSVYVVRYDEEFASKLDERLADDLLRSNIRGTLICIYESQKHFNKLMKYLPDNTVSIDSVSDKFMSKYLQSDFPNLSSRCIDFAVGWSKDYNNARNMCIGLSNLPSAKSSSMSDLDMANIFGLSNNVEENNFKQGIAARNFSNLLNLLERYQEIDSLYYTIFSTMLELDKCICGRSSDMKKYIKKWTREDIYYFFMHTYRELKRSRSLSYFSVRESLIYLFSLLVFSSIPSLEVVT